MYKLSTILSMLILSMSVATVGFAANPCKPIAEACKQQGFYKGGNKVGKGLFENCVMPVVAHNMTLPNASFSNTQLQQCNAILKSHGY